MFHTPITIFNFNSPKCTVQLMKALAVVKPINRLHKVDKKIFGCQVKDIKYKKTFKF